MKTYFHHRYRKKALCLFLRDTVFGTKNKFYLPLGHKNKHCYEPQSLHFKNARMGMKSSLMLARICLTEFSDLCMSLTSF